MAVKPREQWSEAYRKRVERGEARGKTKQQARGHKAAEHRTRKSRSELTTTQRERLKRFALKQSLRMGSDYDDVYSVMRRHAIAATWERFSHMIDEVNTLHRRYKAGAKDQITIEGMAATVYHWSEAEDAPGWLYYH